MNAADLSGHDDTLNEKMPTIGIGMDLVAPAGALAGCVRIHHATRPERFADAVRRTLKN